MTELVPRATIEAIVSRRRVALELYAEAHAALQAASEALDRARLAAQEAAPRETNSYNYLTTPARREFLASLKVPAREDFLATARQLTDADVWAHVIELSELERLMDKTAKDQLRQQLVAEPPEATAENIRATLQGFARDAGTIFRRGIAEAFSKLDRRFRSHDGWKIGSRVILSRAFDDYGSWNYHRNERDTLQDIERAFFVLEGKEPPAAYGGIVGAVEEARRGGSGARQSCVETEFFRLRVFKNGNAHLWFKRDDLLRRVNQLLGEYYGEAIPEEREPDEDTGLHQAKTTPAKRYGFFPTPDPAADEVIAMVPLHRADGEPPLLVLEPSAGTGQLARRCFAKGAIVDCVEIQPHLAKHLRASGLYRRAICADFLAMTPTRQYDRIVMNPPFDRERDIDHVMAALPWLKPDGFLLAIMSAGTELRETRKSQAFRNLMRELNAVWRDLPARSFAASGTNVNTIVLRAYVDGRRFWG